jgi:hypothetical protein
MSVGDPPLPTLPGNLTPEQRTAQTESQITRMRNAGIAASTLRMANDLLSAVNAGIRAQYDYDRSEAIFRTQMQNVYDRGGTRTAESFARATLAAARNVIETQRTTEALAAAKLMIERMAAQIEQEKAREASATSPLVYVAVAVAVAAVGAAAYFASRDTTKPRANPSTRRRRSR